MQGLAQVLKGEISLLKGSGIDSASADAVIGELDCAMEAVEAQVNGVMERDALFSKKDFELGESMLAGKWLVATLKEISCANARGRRGKWLSAFLHN